RKYPGTAFPWNIAGTLFGDAATNQVAQVASKTLGEQRQRLPWTPAVRDRAETVIVGAGIVGTSAAYHLAELGVTDVLVLDQGRLFETGGSTSHAPGLVFQTNGSRTMCRLARYSVELYRSLEVDGEPAWYGVGGVEVATTPERLEELK